jgi:hypothetical protein
VALPRAARRAQPATGDGEHVGRRAPARAAMTHRHRRRWCAAALPSHSCRARPALGAADRPAARDGQLAGRCHAPARGPTSPPSDRHRARRVVLNLDHGRLRLALLGDLPLPPWQAWAFLAPPWRRRIAAPSDRCSRSRRRCSPPV